MTSDVQSLGAYDGRPLIAGFRVEPRDRRALIDPYRQASSGWVGVADADDVDRALEAATQARREMTGIPVHRRASILRRAADLIRERREVLARTITIQTGKALRDARREVDRATYTIAAAAAAVEQLSESVPAPDATPGGEGLMALAIRQPLGVVVAATPFNAPFNLVMHKIAPALAVGNSVVVKPAHHAPISALQAAEILVDAGFPGPAISVLPCDWDVAQRLMGDERIAAISLTGGRRAAYAISKAAPLKRLLFELGGNSANIVHHDADLEWVAAALVAGGFSNTGQSCNSVQRIIAHRSIVEPLIERLVSLSSRLRTGDPLEDDTDIGTLVDEAAARRVEDWIEDARHGGAMVPLGVQRTGAALSPTIVTGVAPTMRIACEEVFGPVVVVIPYDTIQEAISIANSTAYGLQAAVFTRSLDVAFTAASEIEAGAVFVNRSSNFRLDHLPFGGEKDSGNTREGGRWSLEELSRVKLVMFDPSMTGAPHPLAQSLGPR